MRKTIKNCILFLCSVGLAIGGYNYLNNNSGDSLNYVGKVDPFKKRSKQDKFDKPDKLRLQELLMTKDPYLNKIPSERILSAKKKTEQIMRNNLTRNPTFRTTSLSWNERGSNNMGGRTRALLVDKNDATGNTIFAGSVGGGLWRTTNFKSSTPNWIPVNDFFANIAVSCIAQSPVDPNVIYFGTGEGWGNTDAIQGLGIWKSTNGGFTWIHLTSTMSITYVTDLEFDNNGYLYASTRTTGANMRGVIRSTDDGATWTQVLIDPSNTTRGADLERASNGDLYATLGIFTTGKVFRSPANGNNTGVYGSWNEITPLGITSNGFQRTEIAVSANAQKIYAIAQHPSNHSIGGMYRSDDFGATWINLSPAQWCDQNSITNADFSRGQAWYNLIMAVDPSNENTVIAGGIVLQKSTNSGSTWNQMTRWSNAAFCTNAPIIHADVHEVIFINSNEIIVGTDGGVYYSNNGGVSFINKNLGYNVSQYYSAAISPSLGSNLMLAGAQDNGTHVFSNFGINSVSQLSGGDGGFTFIDQTNPAVWITSPSYANYYIYRNNGTYISSVTWGQEGRFVNPADYDNINNILYFTLGPGVYGRSFNIESGTVTTSNIDISTAIGTNRQISAVKVDPGTTTVWFGCSSIENGPSVTPILVKVLRANGPTNGNISQQPNATAFPGPSLPAGAYISSIDVDPSNSNHILLTVSNYGVASVWESADGGNIWTSLDNNGVNLPDMPVRWGMFIPPGYNIGPGATTNGIMLATELGVWSAVTTNGTSTAWSTNNAGLANVRVDMLKLRTSDKTIVAATHGRGIFTSVVPTVLPISLFEFSGKKVNGSNLLDWSTLMESDLKHFEIEKSMNGLDYYTIGKVNAAGNSNSKKNYNFKDDQVLESNYYRLKIVEGGGRSSVSKVVLLKNETLTPQNMWVLNNPFNNQINLRFAKKPSQVHVQLLTIGGVTIAEKLINSTSERIQWDLQKSLPAGTYILRVLADGESFSKKLIKQ